MYAQEFGAQFVDDFGAVFREDDIDVGIADLPGVTLQDGQVVSEPIVGHLSRWGWIGAVRWIIPSWPWWVLR